jgi:hypothetical protein
LGGVRARRGFGGEEQKAEDGRAWRESEDNRESRTREIEGKVGRRVAHKEAEVVEESSSAGEAD